MTDPATVRARPTKDVDVFLPAATKLEYAELERRLWGLGLSHVVGNDAPICRWRTKDGYLVDAMPVHEAVLGFSNRWMGSRCRRLASSS